ncbi:hypothetical protein [Bradyrhizobium sp. BR 10289]|uniref:hypothetical protein n=1 Tax=Bradyrhizobium sp. BR 10289 TaxID=2749993 RepID=UPI001C64FD12|nr:hypothetical protein [Bradyrhizobium sp. BR 10289]MBW7973499.1 hypothetical protein [Bradyrhizobium sp. BR 10289]
MLRIIFGVIWRFTGLGLNRVIDRTIEQLAEAGSPAALIALGIDLFGFEVKGEMLSLVVTCALEPLAMPAAAQEPVGLRPLERQPQRPIASSGKLPVISGIRRAPQQEWHRRHCR